jgi:hypothetical protein
MKRTFSILFLFFGVVAGTFILHVFKESIEPTCYISHIKLDGESTWVEFEFEFSGIPAGELVIVEEGTIFGGIYRTKGGNVIPTRLIDEVEFQEFTTYVVFDQRGFVRKYGRFIVDFSSDSRDVICADIIDGVSIVVVRFGDIK